MRRLSYLLVAALYFGPQVHNLIHAEDLSADCTECKDAQPRLLASCDGGDCEEPGHHHHHQHHPASCRTCSAGSAALPETVRLAESVASVPATPLEALTRGLPAPVQAGAPRAPPASDPSRI